MEYIYKRNVDTTICCAAGGQTGTIIQLVEGVEVGMMKCFAFKQPKKNVNGKRQHNNNKKQNIKRRRGKKNIKNDVFNGVDFT